MSDVTDRLEAAVTMLISDGPVKQRLAQAYTSYIEDLTEADVPGQSRDVLARLHCSLHEVVPVGRETAVQASVRKMSPSDAASYAAEILGLYRDLVAVERRGEHLRIVKTGSDAEQPPPSFLIAAE